jgi:hypothetical protein
MKYAFTNFTLNPNETVLVQGSQTFYTYQNTGNVEALIQGSNNGFQWVDIVTLVANGSSSEKHAYKFLRLVGNTTVAVNRGHQSNNGAEISEEDIAQAVQEYLEDNPPTPSDGLDAEAVQALIDESIENLPPSSGSPPVYLPAMDLSVTQSDSTTPITLSLTACTYVDGVIEPDGVLPTVTIGGDDYEYFYADSEAIFTGSGTCEINFNLPVAGGQIILFGLSDSSLTGDSLAQVATTGGQGAFLSLQSENGMVEGAFFVGGGPSPIDLPILQTLTVHGGTLSTTDISTSNTLTPTDYNAIVSTLLPVAPEIIEPSFTNNQDDIGHDPQVIYFGFVNEAVDLSSLPYILSEPTYAGYYSSKLICIGTDGTTFNLDADISVEAVVDTLTNLSAPDVEIGDVRFKLTIDGVDPDIKHLQYASGVDSLTDLLQITTTVDMKPFIYAKHESGVSALANGLNFNLDLPAETPKECVLTYNFDTLEVSLVIDGGDVQAVGTIPSTEALDGTLLKVFALEALLGEPQALVMEFEGFTQVELSTNDLPEDAKDGDLLPVSVGGERFGEEFEAGDLLELADNLTKGILLVKRTLKRKVLSEDIEFTTAVDGQPEHKIFKFKVEAGKTYKIKAGLLWSSSSNTNGISLAITNVAGAIPTGTFAGNVYVPTTQGQGTDTATSMAIDHNHYLVSTSTTPQANDVYLASYDAVYVCTASSNICLLVGSEHSSGGTTTLKKGSYMEVEEL